MKKTTTILDIPLSLSAIRYATAAACFFLFGACSDDNTKTFSPDHKISVDYNEPAEFVVTYHRNDSAVPVLTLAETGLSPLGGTDDFKLVSASDALPVRDAYRMSSGKRKDCSNEGVERTFRFINSDNVRMDLVLRVYNDGIAFRYAFPHSVRPLEITDESTTFVFPPQIRRWTQKLNPGYEDFYPMNTDGIGDNEGGQWGFPALFEISDSVYVLLSEANIRKGNCGSWLTNRKNKSAYKIQISEKKLSCDTAWTSAWRTAIIGSLADIVESTLITDVSDPCKIRDTSWIKPGIVSWIYWAENHGSKDYQIVKKYIDFAEEFELPYVLIDWEWDQMGNGGNLSDALKYAKEKKINPLLWYNSSTAWCGAGPLFRLNTPESRKKEFAWLSAQGVKGVKIDFFNQDSLTTMNYFIDILEDAAENHLLVNFHGATIPRGWQRTYPNLMSVEGVYGAEWYNNNATLTDNAAWHNCTLPFTRNVVGPMDYTPCTFTDSQYPHITSNGHELALLTVFESTLQHLADRPEGYRMQPAEIRDFISDLPTVWDDTKLISGYPSDHVVIARKSGRNWYIAGLNGTDSSRNFSFDLNFIQAPIKGMDLFSDGNTPKEFHIEKISAETRNLTVPCLPRGGFTLVVRTE